MKKIHLFFTALFACVIFFTGCKKEEFIVTFNPNGGKGAIVTQSFSQKVSQSLMANTFTNRGYTFNGWNRASDGTGTAYEDEQSIKVSGHMVLYAQWLPVTGNFTVTFHPNGAIGEMPPQTFEAGEVQALPPNAFYFENYRFTGWNTSPNGNGKSFGNEQVIIIAEDIILYAQWALISSTYFVSFAANGGEGTMEPQPFKAGEYKQLKANIFTNDNLIFKNWNTKVDGTGFFYQDGAFIQINSNLILYAQWINPEGGGEPCPGIPTVTDMDGNIYNTVKIGSQCWMKENMRTTKYKTGENIPIITTNYQWYNATTGAMCYYDNEVHVNEKYGALYNGYAVNTNNLCPGGWHIPSSNEWDNLSNAIGENEGYKMKTTYNWLDYGGNDGNGSNESGFSAFPAGYRTSECSALGYYALFWTSTIEYGNYQKGRFLNYSNNFLNNDAFVQYYGLSVRCIKD